MLPIGAAVGALLAVAFALYLPVTYNSSTTVVLNPIPGNPYAPDSNASTLEMLQTEAAAVTSQDTAERVIRDLNLDISPERLQRRTFVIVPSNTQTLQITFRTRERESAGNIVDAVADGYLAERRTLAEDWIAQIEDALQQQIDSTNELLQAAETDGSDSLVAGYRADITDLQSQLATARARAIDPGRVLAPGETPPGSGPNRLIKFGGAGALAGLLGGVAAAVMRERSRGLIRDVDDLDDLATTTPITEIAADADADALRRLRMRLAPQVKAKETVALIGLSPGRAIDIGLVLGRSFAGTGARVTLIDGTGHEPGHRDPLGWHNEPGLAEALTHESVATPVPLQVVDNLTYVPSGQDFDTASELLVTDKAVSFIKEVSEVSDLTLLACPPPDDVVGEAMANLADRVVVLVELHRTSYSELSETLRGVSNQQLDLIDVFVLNASP